MDIYRTIIRPIITEKSTRQTQRHTKRHGGAYSFEVHGEASKAQIRDAVEKVYGVKVVDVRTSIKHARVRRNRYGFIAGAHTKKAVVVLNKDSHIDLF
jgi:large subunit ribosomal protein L23